jgi:hypothetical protein
MKTITEPSVVTPLILLLAALATVVIALTLRGNELAWYSNLKVNLVVLLVLGMSICAQGGIGRVAATGQWAHPQAVIGYLLGGAILILSTSVLFNLKLPLIANQLQAFTVIAVLVGVKVVNSVAHYLLSRL